MTHDDRDEKRGVEKDAEADVKDIFREMGDWELSEANSKVLRDLYSGKRKAPSASETETDILSDMASWELSEANSKVLRDLYSGKRKAPSVSDTEEGGVPIEPGA